MQATEEDNKAPRYCQFLLEQELFGGWALVKEWGRQGIRRQVKKDLFETLDAAQMALFAGRDAQIRNGFKVVFVQGEKG